MEKINIVMSEKSKVSPSAFTDDEELKNNLHKSAIYSAQGNVVE